MSGGRNWSGSNWSGSNWEAQNWLGPNDTPSGPVFADMGAVLFGGASAIFRATGEARLTAVISARGEIANAGLLADGEQPPIVRSLLKFIADESPTRNEVVQAERAKIVKQRARDMNDLLCVLTVIADIETED